MATPIKVFLVEDSEVALQILKRLLNSAPEIEVVGTAHDGSQALAQIPAANPDVVLTDLQMPVMDGFDFTQKLMAQFPRPVLVVSNAVQPSDFENIYKLMQLGALDFFPKPTTGSPTDYESMKGALVTKIKVLASKR
ncbi:chemotaxis response regulator containing a CheY-like receiver domain and a methylesterase domain [Synechococcus sp. PCC 7502]|uniref:response regulator n=1 Tax=Synechococcus sp. PCC 7502 TaxID=1173263 RepID=UPI00029F8E4A|nr:response regulator [Synechococcus sp. PCC 7502]AFY74176.1 chemotaxis response regulator containing a CheY-like receiver domain and a methylesterase domain [Synechococcus sp. PCC 7502]